MTFQKNTASHIYKADYNDWKWCTDHCFYCL